MNKYEFLHEDLTAGFQIITNGSGFGLDIKKGDRLSMSNTWPEDGDHALLKLRDGHEVVKFSEREFDESKALLIGTVNSYERSVNGDELFLGDDADKKHGPVACKGCDHLELVEMAGEVTAFCSSGGRLVKCDLRAPHCGGNKRPGAPWGE